MVPYILGKHHNKIVNRRGFIWWNSCWRRKTRGFNHQIISFPTHMTKNGHLSPESQHETACKKIYK